MAIETLITERFALPTLVQMQTDSRLKVTQDLQWYQKPSETWSNTEVLIIRSQTKVEQKLLKHFPQLKLIITTTAGFDHIDLPLCLDRQIQVTHCPASHTQSTAELTWALVLACARKLPQAQNAILRGDWDRNKILGAELGGKTYGVIGLGRVGSRVATIAKAFGMNVLAYDPYQEDEFFEGIERVSLEELLTQSDVVSLHVPLTRETHHLLGDVFLASLSPHAILVNTSRGPVIHEKALIQALQKGVLAAAGLDVFEYEPLPRDSQLLKIPSVVLSPHVGATTREAFDKASQEAYQKLLFYYAHKGSDLGLMQDTLPPKAPWYR